MKPLCLLVLAGLASLAQGQAMDVEELEILCDVSRTNGVAGSFPYAFEITASGTNIVSISVQPPNGGALPLLFDGDEWRYSKESFGSLAAIDGDPEIGFGSFVFTFTGISAVETLTVTYDPGSTDPHTGYGSVLCPIPGQLDSILDPTMAWTCAGGPCGNFAWYMETYPLVGPGASYEADLLDPAASIWTPGVLTANKVYGFWLSSGSLLPPGAQSLQTTPGLDDVDYFPGFETNNTITFKTHASNVQLVDRYCTAGTSASGCEALISSCGLASASAASGFFLIATRVEPSKDGIFFYGTNGRQANSWGNGTSYQCVVPPAKRAGVLTGVGTAGLCNGFFVQDLAAHWTAKPHHDPGAGATVQAQLWYRDPLNTSNQTTSLSDAIEFPVGP